jgi:CBS domain-containing protein
MKIRDAMTRDVRTIAPSDTIRQAAELMADIDAGVLPVAENDRMVGMITDRDIAIRAIGAGKGPDAKTRDVMSPEVKYCYEDDDVEEVCENMADQQIRRLPVVSRDKRLVGIVSLSDLAKRADTEAAGEALEGITRSGGLHTHEPLH